MIKKTTCAAIFALLLFAAFLGCEGPAGGSDLPTFSSYREIPGVSAEEVLAVEALKGQRDSFILAMRPSTEAFYGEDGEIRGFAVLGCEWLTELFGIPFIPSIHEWGDLIAGLESHEIDFTGDLGATEERRRTYFMTTAVAERTLKTFRIEGSRPLSEIAESRPLRYAFLRGATAIESVGRVSQDEYEIILVDDDESAYMALKNGEADAYFTVDISEAAFDDYSDVVVSDFFPLIINHVYLMTPNPALAPIISVVQKALDSGSIRNLHELHVRGYKEYKKYKLFRQLSKEETAYIQSRPIVPFAASNTNYPVSFYNAHDKEWQGIAFDMLKEVEELTGLRFELVHDENTSWSTALSMLENGEADMISGIVHSNARRNLFLWADTPILTDFYALISKSDYRNISLDEIWYERIGIINDTAYAEVFNRWFPGHNNTVAYEDINAAMDALERGEVDMIMANDGQLLMITHYRENAGYKANVIFNYTFESAFGFNIEAPILSSIVDKALRMVDTKIISEQWMRKTYDYRVKLAQAQVPWIIGAITLLLTVLSVIIMLQRKKTEGKRLEELVQVRTAEINRQQTLAQEVNNAAILLLGSDMEDNSGSMSQGVQLIARTIEVDRISVWQNQRKENDKQLYYKLVTQWSSAELPELDRNSDFMYKEVLPGWEKLFTQKSCVNGPVVDFEEPERSQLGVFGIQSLLAVPIYVENEFWGFISFDDYHQKRVFSEMETVILQSWGLLVIGTIQRNEIMLEMHRTLNKLEAIINNYKGIIWSVGKDGIVTTFSGQFVTKMGMKPAFFEGKTLEFVQQRNKYLDIIDKQVEKTFHDGPQEWASDVNDRIFHSATMPIYDIDGNITGVAGSTDEITEFFKLQRELEAALDAAKAASRAKSAFLANMSHEMRTPMNAIIGMGALGKSSSDIERKDHCFSKIENASKHLLGVINDILDISKIEANKFELTPVDFKFEKMLRRVVDVITFRIDEKHQKFTINIDKNIPRILIGDDHRLGQVITNLLGNAVKFTPEYGSIHLETRLLEEKDDVCTIMVSVIDTGIGISPEQQERLFLSFQQADTTTVRKFGGTGLGLAISKNIIEIMGGKIEVKSEVGKGSTFSITIPAKRGAEKVQGLLASHINLQNVRVIVIDDDLDVLESVKEILQGLGISCDTASTGEEALRLVGQKSSYDIYFIDWQMPGIDGITLTSMLKDDSFRSGNNAVIMISSAEWSDIEEKAKKAGVDRYLSKPLFPTAIEDAINECLGLNPQPAEESLPVLDGVFKGRRILLVDDVEINREIVVAMLEVTGLEIDCAENGKEAVRMFSEAPDKYEMIFMDIQMPEMDGYEATRSIRALDHPKAKTVPIVAMTANMFKEDIDKSLEAGMNSHVGKPLEIDVVLEKLRKYLLG